MRFSGHETFPCRYSWIPKAFRALNNNTHSLSGDEGAMRELGLGKNMVRAVRFWIQAMGVADPALGGGYALSPFALAVFGEGGLDPYLEDVRTLWLLHWKLSTHPLPNTLFAWDFLLNRWHHPEIARGEVLRAFRSEADRMGRRLSEVTLAQHFDVFLHTYVPTRSAKGAVLEDNLDSPLVELGLIRKVGERRIEGGRREPVYAFRREPKPELTSGVLAYCLADFWRMHRAAERTLSFRDVTIAPGSVGQVFKLPESDIYRRLETIQSDSAGAFGFRDSAALPLVTVGPLDGRDLLTEVYAEELSLA
jgi:hypothetical protein